MKTNLSLLLAAVIAVGLVGSTSVNTANAGDPGAKGKKAPLLVPNAVSDPKLLRYIITGVRSTVGPGTSTFVHCTNHNNVNEIIQFNLRDANGTLLNSEAFTVPRLQTIQIATRNSNLFDAEEYFLAVDGLPAPVAVDTGIIQVVSTTAKLVCTAGMVDSELNDVPNGVALHLVRVNPQEGWID